MIKLQGKGVSKGIAIGKLKFNKQTSLDIEFKETLDTEKELLRFENARTKAIEQLSVIEKDTEAKLGKENAALFEVHQMMLDDLDYREAITTEITENKAISEYAVGKAAKQFSQMFLEMDDEYMQARSADVQDISRRVIEILENVQNNTGQNKEPMIFAGTDFTPSETAQFDRDFVLGIVTAEGSKNSHTAIFARTLGLPAIIGLQENLDEKYDGLMVVIDGEIGEVIINPDNETLADKQNRKQCLIDEKNRLEAFRGKKTLTKSGREVNLYANIGTVDDVDFVLDNDAEGIGLFRSEFLYLESKDYPTEESQFKAYSTVAKKMGDKPVIIRTLDIGADKQASYFNLPKEENPAMGMRAIRICLSQPEIFKTQLRAIYRASAHGNIYIMLPMIISVEEVLKSKKIIEEVKAELTAENVEFNPDIPVGIMIETPAAVMISDLLAKEVDFFSIGTNDLTQYTLAADRQNESISEFIDIHHEAVLRMIAIVCENAHDNGIWAGICGELAADTSLTEYFNKIGVDELSVSPSAVLAIREKVSQF